MTYRQAFRVGEVIDLRWSQVDFKSGRLHVDRLKNGDPSIHYLESDEVKALRQLKRDYPESDFVFASQRQGPLSARSVHNIVARAGEFAASISQCIPICCDIPKATNLRRALTATDLGGGYVCKSAELILGQLEVLSAVMTLMALLEFQVSQL